MVQDSSSPLLATLFNWPSTARIERKSWHWFRYQQCQLSNSNGSFSSLFLTHIVDSHLKNHSFFWWGLFSCFKFLSHKNENPTKTFFTCVTTHKSNRALPKRQFTRHFSYKPGQVNFKIGRKREQLLTFEHHDIRVLCLPCPCKSLLFLIQLNFATYSLLIFRFSKIFGCSYLLRHAI